MPSFRAWLASVDLRSVIAIHLTRFIGVYFLVLYARGLLPFDFAVLGGWGDIVIASDGSLCGSSSCGSPRLIARCFCLWNLCGLIDIVFVVAPRARMAAAGPGFDGPAAHAPAQPPSHFPRCR